MRSYNILIETVSFFHNKHYFFLNIYYISWDCKAEVTGFTSFDVGMLPLLSDFDQIKMTCNEKCDCYHDIQANPIKQVSNQKNQ